MYDSDWFMCAAYWTDFGADYDIDACNGAKYHVRDEYDQNNDDWYHPMGSIFVKPGCKLYMYMETDFLGGLFHWISDTHVISGPAEIYDNKHWYHGGPGPLLPFGPDSFKCRCEQKKVDCDPGDSLEVVLRCDNTDGVAEAKCTYRRTIGTKYSDEISNGWHIDTSVGAEMALQFWLLFEDKVGVSVNTGYDWKHTSSETKSEQTTTIVEGTAPAGMVLVIEQATGYCGQSDVKTDFFKISQQDSTGKVLLEKFGRFLKNQTFVEIDGFNP